jgi:uncharacterized membrane protein YkvA (DUF1232 family)
MEQLRRIVTLLRDPRTPMLPRIAVALAVAYVIWPVDLVPDFLFPVAGYLDDLTFVWLALRWLLKSGKAVPLIEQGGAASRPPDPPLAPRE